MTCASGAAHILTNKKIVPKQMDSNEVVENKTFTVWEGKQYRLEFSKVGLGEGLRAEVRSRDGGDIEDKNFSISRIIF